MASKLKQLQSKACQASQFVSKHGSAYYKQLMEQNKQYVQEPATVEKCNELSKQLFYTRLARLIYRPYVLLFYVFHVAIVNT
ncbi:putative ATP synthase, F0 complex, subunit G [Helianthus annuus]|nr:putative ATP synthase, F0 complex, subunit G [Helianthus annuus]